MRDEASIAHLDLDAFFASVEQLQKPTLRGKPVIVAGLGSRGVVATASYEARRNGVGSAMPTSRARRLCPHGIFTTPRGSAYRAYSERVMAIIRAVSDSVEQISFDEAFFDLDPAHRSRPEQPPPGDTPERAALRKHLFAHYPDLASDGLDEVCAALRHAIADLTGLNASVGLGTSKLIAKLASDAAKPNGQLHIRAGDELDYLNPLQVRRLWGVGPATADKLTRMGITTVSDLRAVPESSLIALVGKSAGRALFDLARGEDDRRIISDRDAKSVGAEETFPYDLTDLGVIAGQVDLICDRVARRLAAGGHAGRTVTLKVRFADFRTVTRSHTLPAATDRAEVLSRQAIALLEVLSRSGEMGNGIRLAGVSVSHLTDAVQDTLPLEDDAPVIRPVRVQLSDPVLSVGEVVEHDFYGLGWVAAVTVDDIIVNFEGPDTAPGRTRTFTARTALKRAEYPVPNLPGHAGST